MASSSGGSFNRPSANSTRCFPPHRRVTSFADLFSSDHKQEDQQTINQPKSSSSSGEIMNLEQHENIESIPTQMSSLPAAASLPPLSPSLSPCFSPSNFFADHLPVLHSPSHAPPSPTMETFAGLFSTSLEEEINHADLSSFAPTSAVLTAMAPPSVTMQTFAGLFSTSTEEEIDHADLSSFAPTSAVMAAMESLEDKEEDGTLINSQAEFSTEPTPFGPLPPSSSQDIIIPAVETTHCFPQDIIPTVETTHFLPQDIPTFQNTPGSRQDITTVGTSVYGNSAYVRKKRKSNDGYRWTKYGEKPLKGSSNPRSYYKCNHPKCPSRKKVERDLTGNITEVIYKGTHNHPKPPSSQIILEYHQTGFGEGSSMRDDLEINEPNAKRRNGQDKSAPCRRRVARESRIAIQTTSDAAMLDDGYRWRKYGEKTVKENPNPRSYYKCSSNGCIVTKQIERSPDDLRLVITTYEGKHNHGIPAQRIRLTYPLGRLPTMNNNTSPAAVAHSATSSNSDPTMPQITQNQTPNANQTQQTSTVTEEPNDNFLFYFDDSFLDDLFK